MRQVSREIGEAFNNGESKTLGNTSTDGVVVWLFEEPIVRYGDNCVEVSLAGWPGPTTRERINSVLECCGINAGIFQKGGRQYIQVGNQSEPMPTHGWVAIEVTK
jgi:hypothetical protein